MYNFVQGLLLIDSFLIVIAVLIQPTKQQDALNALSSGAANLFGKQKSRGFEAVMERITVVLGILFFIFAIWLEYLSSH